MNGVELGVCLVLVCHILPALLLMAYSFWEDTYLEDDLVVAFLLFGIFIVFIFIPLRIIRFIFRGF